MELILALAGLYALQCLCWLPGGATIFVRGFGPRAWLVSDGPGWRIVHPFPWRATLQGSRPPWSLRDGRLEGWPGQSWLAGGIRGDHGALLDASLLAGAEARGPWVRIAGRKLARAFTPEQAERWAAWLRAAAASQDPAALEDALAEGVKADLSLERCAEEHRRLQTATGALRRVLGLYALAVFVGLPAGVVLRGAEPVLLYGLPAVVLLHAIALLLYLLAHRELHPDAGPDRVEAAFSAAFYPPLLLASYHQLCVSALGGFHPAALAACFLPRSQARAFLRAELHRGAGTRDPGALERRALWHLAEELDGSRDALLAPPCRVDPHARSYCPVCHAEYVVAAGACSDCRAPLATWEPPSASSPCR